MDELQLNSPENPEKTAGAEGTESAAETKSADAGSQLSLWPAEPEPLGSPAPPPGPDPPWSLADLGAFILFAAVSFLLANMVAVAVFLALRRGLAWKTTMEQAFLQTPFVVSMQTGWELLWFVFIYLTVTIKYRQRFWEAVKWAGRPHAGAAAYLLGGVALAFLAQLLFYLFPSEKELPIEKLFSSPGSAYLLAVFGICVAPFVEELVFRGYFYPVFEKLWGLLAAVVLTALLFASIHIPQLKGGWQEIASIFVVGAAFSYCRGKTGSLVPPFLMHLAYNASLFVSLYLSTDRFRSLRG